MLIALAKHERKRARLYSNRDFKDKYILEKLLALSLFTKPGLTRSTIQALGDIDICNGKNGETLWESVKNTPYWIKNNREGVKKKREAHLERLEPDIVASAFLFLALLEESPSPNLPDWLSSIVQQTQGHFAETLGRISHDLSLFNKSHSEQIEQCSIDMLERYPELIAYVDGITYQKSSIFCLRFALTVCNQLLQSEVRPVKLAALLNKQATMLSSLRRHEVALESIQKAIDIYHKLADTRPDFFKPDLASCINNKANIFCDIGQFEIALEVIQEAVNILRQLAETELEASKSELAVTLNNQANIFCDLGQFEMALEVVQEAVDILRQLAETESEAFKSDLALTLSSQAIILSNLGGLELALEAIQEAVDFRRQLSEMKPDVYKPDLAIALNKQAKILTDLGKLELSLQATQEAIDIFRQLAEMQPDIFKSNLAFSLNYLADTMFDLGQRDEALRAVKEAIDIYSQLGKEQPDAYYPRLAKSLSMQALMLSEF